MGVRQSSPTNEESIRSLISILNKGSSPFWSTWFSCRLLIRIEFQVEQVCSVRAIFVFSSSVRCGCLDAGSLAWVCRGGGQEPSGAIEARPHVRQHAQGTQPGDPQVVPRQQAGYRRAWEGDSPGSDRGGVEEPSETGAASGEPRPCSTFLRAGRRAVVAKPLMVRFLLTLGPWPLVSAWPAAGLPDQGGARRSGTAHVDGHQRRRE